MAVEQTVDPTTITEAGFRRWVEENTLRGQGRITGNQFDQSPVATYISSLTGKLCWVLSGGSDIHPSYILFQTGTWTNRDVLHPIEFDQPQQLPHWATMLHRKLFENLGHVSPKAEWFFSGRDVLYILDGGEFVQ